MGLCLGLGLARQGTEVLLLEKNPDTAEHSRAPAIWPATQEILADLGVIDQFLQQAITVPRLSLQDVDKQRTLFCAPLAQLSDITSYPQLLVLPQSDTEAILRDALLQQPTARLRFNCKVESVSQQQQGVQLSYTAPEGRRRAQCRIAVGCDGGKSLVREQIGAALEGKTYQAQAALADVDIEDSAHLPFPRLTTSPALAIGIRMTDNRWRLILPFAPGDSIPLDQRIEEAVQSLFGKPYHNVWQSEFRLHQRLSTLFSQGAIVLAGDAAHLNSPVGGQGMNAGIIDASLLGPAILAALDKGTDAPLHHYAQSRRDEIQSGVNRFTDKLTRILLWRQGRMIRLVLSLANMAMAVPPVRRRILKKMAMLT